VNATFGQYLATATLTKATSIAVVPTISVGNISANVAGTAVQVPFTVSLSAATTNTVTVIYGTSDGTATAAVALTLPSGAR